MTDSIGVLVMAYGGPNRLEDVEPFLLDVRGHRRTSPALVEEVRRRYATIGGRSPILERTRAQAGALAAALRGHNPPFQVTVGMRHWHPYINAALAGLARGGVRRAVGIVMAPHYSRLSIGAYYRRVEDARSGIEIAGIMSWHLAPGYVRAVASRVTAAVNRLPEALRQEAPVVFTAHSLPESILAWNDPYPRQLAETVTAVLAELGPRPWRFAYQSAARTADRWLGPDVGEVLDGLAHEGTRAAVVAPIGFVSEHVEVLYDLDCELAQRAAGLGVRLERAEMLNDDRVLIGDLARLVRAAAREAAWR